MPLIDQIKTFMDSAQGRKLAEQGRKLTEQGRRIATDPRTQEQARNLLAKLRGRR